MATKQLYTIPQAAERLNLDYDQTRFLISRKQVVKPLRVGHVRLITDEQVKELKEYIRSHPWIYGGSK
jgi:DNA-binding transcriptional MerR regulator